jgi:hypothetical protein
MSKPSQDSAASQRSPTARHTVPAGFRKSRGQKAVTPVQDSAASQRSAASRHGVSAGSKTSAGQASPPSQNSATSQVAAPGAAAAAGRHTWVVGAFPSAGQVAPAPLHTSAASHTPAASRHSVPSARNPRQSAAQQAESGAVGSHCSPASTWPLPHSGPSWARADPGSQDSRSAKAMPSRRSEIFAAFGSGRASIRIRSPGSWKRGGSKSPP